jgi:NNP family nitrate/nitrite transporter-like MFS transporter
MRAFLRAGHLPTLIASLLHFETSFMVWVLMGGLGVLIARDLGLSPAEKGLIVGIPLLGGAFTRVPIGWLGDRCGAKRVGIATLAFVAILLLGAWQKAADLPGLLVVGIGLGVAGSSFAIALPLAGSWYPPRYQGTAMGLAAAGNSGTVLAGLLAPRLGEAVGWNGVFGLAIIPVVAVALLFALLARERPRSEPRPSVGGDTLGLLREPDLWWFSLLYSMTFGGYAGLSSFLAIFFHDQYGVSAVAAGGLVALCAVAGSLVRPVGGVLADRFGGIRLLSFVFALVPLAMVAPMTGAPLEITVLSLIAGMAGLGLGNGAVFQLVPWRFPAQLGLVTGITGAAGGVGGFLLPAVMGIQYQTTGSFGPGFLLYAVSLGYLFLCLKALHTGWRFTWLAPAPAPRQVSAGDV